MVDTLPSVNRSVRFVSPGGFRGWLCKGIYDIGSLDLSVPLLAGLGMRMNWEAGHVEGQYKCMQT